MIPWYTENELLNLELRYKNDEKIMELVKAVRELQKQILAGGDDAED